MLLAACRNAKSDRLLADRLGFHDAFVGERDFHPLSANFLLPHWLPSHWANYAEGKRRAGVAADPADWRIARTIFVADDDRVAERYGKRDANSP